MIEFELDEIFSEMKKLLIDKNDDYGGSFTSLFKKFGLLSLIIRLSDKVKRLEKLSDDELKIKNESIEDTLKDIIGYGILGLIELRKK